MRRTLFGLACSLIFATTSTTTAADLEAYLPKDTDLVVSLNVRQVLDSPAIKDHAGDLIRLVMSSSKDLQEAIQTLGLNPLADFSRVSVGVGLENVNNPRAIVIIDGKFDAAKIAKLMDDLIKKDPKKYGIEKIGGKSLYRLTAANQPVYAATIDANVVVLGTVKEFVANAADAAKGGRKSEIRKELSTLLAAADAKASLYLAAPTKGRLGGITLPDADLKKLIEQVETITGEVRIDKDLQVMVTLTASNAQVAKEVQSLAESAISLYRLQLKLALSDQPELRPLVELASSVKATQKDKQIVITGNLASAAIEKLFKQEKK